MKPKGKKSFVGCAEETSAQYALDPAHERALRVAERVQRRVGRQMLELPGIAGIGSSLDRSGEPLLLFLLERDEAELRRSVPAEIDGVATDVLITGPIVAF